MWTIRSIGDLYRTLYLVESGRFKWHSSLIYQWKIFFDLSMREKGKKTLDFNASYRRLFGADRCILIRNFLDNR